MRHYGGLEELILSVSRLRVFQNRREERSKVSKAILVTILLFGKSPQWKGLKMNAWNLLINGFKLIRLIISSSPLGLEISEIWVSCF